MTCSAGAFPVPDFCLIFAPLKGYDEPEILRSQLSRFGPISADAGHWPKLPVLTVRVYRDEEYIKTLSDEIDRFNDELAALVERIRNYGIEQKEAA
ncbi:MAG: hypothetical protein M9945_07670 [Aquamicrobium sp.]|uniref:hypothetical protein n=1 Tax=Aquamicrobium sp. TaxID=1872579 RepID=UPI00349EB0CC|nr:hypothetical protein [Aquamicrobium sp.]